MLRIGSDLDLSGFLVPSERAMGVQPIHTCKPPRGKLKGTPPLKTGQAAQGDN